MRIILFLSLQLILFTGIKDLDEREGCGIQLKDGAIVMGIFYNNDYTPDGTYNSGDVKKLPPGPVE